MQKYRDPEGNSGISAYLSASDSIIIEFKDERIYLYSYFMPGAVDVEAMKALAEAGDGLNTYINQHVRDRYDRRLD